MIYFKGKLRGISACTILVRTGKGGDEVLCMKMDIDRYFIVDSWVYIMMISLIGGSKVNMDYEEGVFNRIPFLPTSPICESRSPE